MHTGAGLWAGTPAFENLCDWHRSLSRVLPSVRTQQPNTWKAMNTTNATEQSVPGFWQKWWNALVKYFNRGGTCACASEKTSTAEVEQPRATENKPT